MGRGWGDGQTVSRRHRQFPSIARRRLGIQTRPERIGFPGPVAKVDFELFFSNDAVGGCDDAVPAGKEGGVYAVAAVGGGVLEDCWCGEVLGLVLVDGLVDGGREGGVGVGERNGNGEGDGEGECVCGNGREVGEEEEKEMMHVGGWHRGYLIMNPCI